MVKFWDDALDKAILRTKRRIKLMEKHGKGIPAMQEKNILKQQMRQKELRT